MKREDQNQPGERNYSAGIQTPRFDEETRATARPVVPLGSASGSDINRSPARGARTAILSAKSRWIQAAIIILAIGAVVVATLVLFDNNETIISSGSSQTNSGAASLIGTVPATSTLRQTEKADASNAPEKALGISDSRDSMPVMYEIKRDEANTEEYRERDDDDDKEKTAGRARKEEKTRLERRRKEAEKLAERRRDFEKGGEAKARLIGVYTEP